MDRPIIGITCDTVSDHTPQKWKYESPHEYCRVVAAADGLPLLLPYEQRCIPDYLRLCDGFVLSGGDDPDLTAYGTPAHAASKIMHHERQAFELALLKALDATRHPVLGICLGMQLMAIHAGGRLHQHLPDVARLAAERAAAHDRQIHPVQLVINPHPHLPPDGVVHSRHHQAVDDPGFLRVVAEHDGVIEALDHPGAGDRFYLGVQWHPECTVDESMGLGLIRRLVDACRSGEGGAGLAVRPGR